MVYASARLIIGESIAMRSTYADIVMPVNKHGFEPFHALYYRKKCLPAVVAALEAGQTKAQSFFAGMDLYEFGWDEIAKYEPQGGCFINANTPDELASLEKSIKRFDKE